VFKLGPIVCEDVFVFEAMSQNE